MEYLDQVKEVSYQMHRHQQAETYHFAKRWLDGRFHLADVPG
jgi:hypothetical protein